MKEIILFLTAASLVLAFLLLNPQQWEAETVKMGEIVESSGTGRNSPDRLEEASVTTANHHDALAQDARGDKEAARIQASNLASSLHEAVKRRDKEAARAIVMKIMEEKRMQTKKNRRS